MLTYTVGVANVRICAEAAANYTDSQITVFGLSTDAKPVDLPNASVFHEMDTQQVFLFDAVGKCWLPQ